MVGSNDKQLPVLSMSPTTIIRTAAEDFSIFGFIP